MTQRPVEEIVAKTDDAYSFRQRYYTPAEWASNITYMRSIGFSDEKIAWFLRSKIMRWAHDMLGPNGLDRAMEQFRAGAQSGRLFREMEDEAAKDMMTEKEWG